MVATNRFQKGGGSQIGRYIFLRKLLITQIAWDSTAAYHQVSTLATIGINDKYCNISIKVNFTQAEFKNYIILFIVFFTTTPDSIVTSLII